MNLVDLTASESIAAWHRANKIRPWFPYTLPRERRRERRAAMIRAREETMNQNYRRGCGPETEIWDDEALDLDGYSPHVSPRWPVEEYWFTWNREVA